MKRSGFLKLNARDFFKGLIMAAGSAAITFLYQLIQAGPLVFDAAMFKSLGLAALSAIIVYLGKNLFENTEGSFGSKK